MGSYARPENGISRTKKLFPTVSSRLCFGKTKYIIFRGQLIYFNPKKNDKVLICRNKSVNENDREVFYVTYEQGIFTQCPMKIGASLFVHHLQLSIIKGHS